MASATSAVFSVVVSAFAPLVSSIESSSRAATVSLWSMPSNEGCCSSGATTGTASAPSKESRKSAASKAGKSTSPSAGNAVSAVSADSADSTVSAVSAAMFWFATSLSLVLCFSSGTPFSAAERASENSEKSISSASAREAGRLASIASDSGTLTMGSGAKNTPANVCSLSCDTSIGGRDRSVSSFGSKGSVAVSEKSPEEALSLWLSSTNPVLSMAGSTEGSSRPSFRACAARRKAEAFQALASPVSMSVAQQPKASNV